MTTKAQVLKLLKQSNNTLSGEKIAQKLAISRTAVWKAIKELEKGGYTFEHLKTGYRYLPQDRLDDLAIATGLPDLAVATKDISESTMKDAKLAQVSGVKAPFLVVADMQTAAHGRFNRPFFAQKGEGIYMSLLLTPNQSFAELPQYTILAAVAVCQAIEKLTPYKPEIKWVNDIYLDGRKICGILSEAQSDFESGIISHVIIGMGLNFAIAQEDFPADLQTKATSLFADGTAPFERNLLIHEIWQHFFALLAALPQQDFLTEYRKRSFVLGQNVSFNQNGQTYSGIAQDITDEGQLVVKTPQQTFTLNSGEISLSAIGKAK
ncbi:biotin--[acetyl-CoA-carboxylase] ligase [Enterococcus dispar]|uniref:biotin--[acetyl-CoA-carboxylase] ligase n=1 Tax=Enterococcus dispar TaxID=44009 RepID=UPI002493CCF7|nr:biotin--[acetyl-CoA-carboxylase] ligase [Enterococcus dispar]